MVKNAQVGLFCSGEVGVSKAEYFLAMSSLQKFIRRGMVAGALSSARVVHLYNSSSLRRRLMVIAMEDVGLGDWGVLFRVLSLLRRGRLNWGEYADVVGDLCSSKKNRDADDAFNMVIWAKSGRCSKVVIPDDDEFSYLMCGATYLDSQGEDRYDVFWDRVIHESREVGVGCLGRVEFLRQFTGIASHHACHLALLILARWDCEQEEVRSPLVDIVDHGVVDSIEVFDDAGAICNIGLDFHTRHGKIVYGKVARDFGIDEFDVHCFEFFKNACRLNYRVAWRNDYRDLVLKYLYGEDCSSWGRLIAANEKVHSMRRWAWDSIAVPEINAYRSRV